MLSYKRQTELPEEYIKKQVAHFLEEDAPNGDLTSIGTIDPDEYSTAIIQAEEDMILAGVALLKPMFGEDAEYTIHKKDGDFVKDKEIIAEVTAKSIDLLTKERVLLNLMQRLSGIATMTKRYTKIAEPYGTKVLDTRKVTPGLRLFEKYAVAMGGGHNHRLDLSSGIMIKDNHIKAAGGIFEAIERIKKRDFGLPIELEVDRIDQLKAGIEAGADAFLLDNMKPETVEYAVELVKKYALGDKIFLEASGGITIDTLEDYCKTGVHAISIGALTHSAKSMDIHIEFE